MTSKIHIALVLASASLDLSAEPRFNDFPVQVYEGRVKAVRIADAQSRDYATALRAATGRKVNFAGRFVLASWGCGASCVMAAAVDAKTGKVAWVPFTVSNWPPGLEEPLEFRRNSRLLIVRGSLNESGSAHDVAYYIFDGRRFEPTTKNTRPTGRTPAGRRAEIKACPE